MPSQKQVCFDQNVLQRFLNESLADGLEGEVMSHIGSCESCRSALEKLAGNETVWSDIEDHLAEPSLEDAAEEDMVRDQRRALRAVKGMLAPTDNPEMMGRIGQYEVCGVIGRGSSGIVVKALDPRLSRYVAIKLLAPVYSNIGSSRRRFEREGRAVASLNNPHVIPIHAVQDFQGTPYIVMQYLPDGSLQQRIDKTGPLSTREVAGVGMQIAKGLAAAHAAGIVHRDVKPANVLLESGVDSAMVTDFGLARVVDEATMTRSGSISGTPQYMSPEQAQGESVDPRSDLFSLGSVMYTACTGHSPFRAETVFGVIKRVCDNDPRPVRESNPDIAGWMAAFIDKLHSKDRNDRFESADQVAELLHQEIGHMQNPTLIAKPARNWWQKSAAIPAISSESKPKQSLVKSGNGGRRSIWKYIAGGGALLAFGGFSTLALSGFFEGEHIEPCDMTVSTSAVAGAGGGGAFSLGSIQDEVEQLEKFSNQVEATIDVEDGGVLFFRSNLGTLNVSTHDKATVEMKLKHTVAAADKEIAAKIFKALKVTYDIDSKGVEGDLRDGKDAVIVAKFPTRKLTNEEIQAVDDFEELKDALLVRNNSHYTNAEFQLFVPEEFSLDLVTSAGPIKSADINGSVKLVSHGGRIQIADVTKAVNIVSHGGNIEAGNLGDETQIETHGGNIVVLNVDGKFVGTSHGGNISAGRIEGSVEALTHGGKVELVEAEGPVKAESHGGSITVMKAHDSVVAEARAGKIVVNFIDQPAGDSTLNAHAGSVRVGYVEGIGFDIDATTKNGKISGPFLEGKRVKGTVQHQLNEGTAKLEITSDNGSVKFQVVDEADLDAELEETNEFGVAQRAFQKAYDTHMAGNIDEAIELHKAAAKYESTRVLATYNLGCAWALKGKKDRAFEALNQAVDFGMDDLGQFEGDSDLDSLRDDPRYEEVISRVKELGEKSQTSAEAAAEFGRLLSQGNSMFQSGEYDKSEKFYRSGLVLEPKNVEALHMLGSSVHALGRLDEALEFHKVVAVSDDSHLANMAKYNIACVYSLRKDTDAAIEQLEKAIKSGFVDAQHIKLDDDLDNIRNDERFEELIDLAKELADEVTDKACDECEDESCDEKSEDKVGEVSDF